MVAAAGEVFALHRTLHDLLLAERAAEELVHSVGGGSTGCGAASDTRPWVNLLADAHADLCLVSGDFQELAYHRSDDVLLDVFRKRNRGVIYYRKAVTFLRRDFKHVSDFVKGETHNVEAAAEVGY